MTEYKDFKHIAGSAKLDDVHSTWITMFFRRVFVRERARAHAVIRRLCSCTRLPLYEHVVCSFPFRYCCNSMLLWWTMSCNRQAKETTHRAKETIPSNWREWIMIILFNCILFFFSVEIAHCTMHIQEWEKIMTTQVYPIPKSNATAN